MRPIRCLSFSLVVLAVLSFPILAKADSIVLGLEETEGLRTAGPNVTIGQDVLVSTTTSIDGFAFYLTDPSGAALTYTITDLTTSTPVFSETFDDTTLDPTLTDIAIPETSKEAWLELYTSPITLAAGDVYDFSVSGADGVNVGDEPTYFTEIGLAPTGNNSDHPELGLRVWDPPAAVTPEPSSLVLMGTGILVAAGAMRRRMTH